MFFVYFVVFLAIVWFLQESHRNQPPKPSQDPVAPESTKARLITLAYAVPVVAMLALATSSIGSCAGPIESASKEMSQSEALARCQHVLKSASKDPETAEVPYVENFGKGSDYYFAWGAESKPVRMKNSYGAMLSAGASCIVNKESGKLLSLTLDGKSIM